MLSEGGTDDDSVTRVVADAAAAAADAAAGAGVGLDDDDVDDGNGPGDDEGDADLMVNEANLCSSFPLLGDSVDVDTPFSFSCSPCCFGCCWRWVTVLTVLGATYAE